MAWVRMKVAHDFRPLGVPGSTIHYKAGHRYSVKDDVATQLEFLGKAERIRTPSRDEAPPKPVRGPRARRARSAGPKARAGRVQRPQAD